MKKDDVLSTVAQNLTTSLTSLNIIKPKSLPGKPKQRFDVRKLSSEDHRVELRPVLGLSIQHIASKVRR